MLQWSVRNWAWIRISIFKIFKAFERYIHPKSTELPFLRLDRAPLALYI